MSETDTSLAPRFFQRGNDFLGTTYPFTCGAMTWISTPKLAAAASNAGILGCLAAGNMPPEELKENINRTREMTSNPFAVNLITIAPAYRDQLEMIRYENLSVVIFAGSFPKREEIRMAKESGAKVLCFVSTLSIAKRMERYGVDGMILEGMEAGGHVGHVSLTVLLQQVLFQSRDMPVFVAGGVGTGRFAAHLLLMGASGVQLGTRFVMTEECEAHDNFKEAFKKANARNASSTPQYDSRLPVVPVRALHNQAMDEFGRLQLSLLSKLDREEITREDAQQQVEEYWIGALRKAVQDGDVDTGSMMAGQSVGLVDDIKPMNEVVGDLVGETERELERVQGLFS